jgi:protein phosphatase
MNLPVGPTGPALVIPLPEPCLVVLVGAAGSGKSTLAARLFEPDQVLSSDAYRGIVSGDESDQGATRLAFSILYRELDRRLRLGLTTVIDATNVTSYARRSLTRRAARRGVPAIALVLDLESPFVLARNATRPGRIVPLAAVERQLAQLARSLRRDELANEGFAAVYRIRTALEVDGMTIATDR